MNLCVFYKYVGWQLFTVGSANPQRLPDGGHAGKDEVVMVGIGDVGGGHNLDVGEKSAAKIVDLYENAWHNWGFLFGSLLFKRYGRLDFFSAVPI